VGSTNDVDLSRTASRMHRDFYGAQLNYLGFERHEPFLYVLWQEDHNREERFRPGQRFDYDSFYVGLGSTGEVLPRLRYATEWVGETGRGYADGDPRYRTEVCAWAFDHELEYLFPGERKARASMEYLFGSGDADRLFSPTNTLAGNVRDFRDTSYIGFGFRDTGLALAPEFSNLHVWRMGASFRPWPNHRRLAGLEVGSDWYLYYKHHADGAVSDPFAVNPSGYLGWEMDYHANWEVTADLTWTARGGLFFPGGAFDDRDPRPFFLVGMTWSF
jgi:hypothetical protein